MNNNKMFEGSVSEARHVLEDVLGKSKNRNVNTKNGPRIVRSIDLESKQQLEQVLSVWKNEVFKTILKSEGYSLGKNNTTSKWAVAKWSNE